LRPLLLCAEAASYSWLAAGLPGDLYRGKR
jgi:hypothetical protein